MPWARPSRPRFQDCVNTLILFICYLSQGKANPQWTLKAPLLFVRVTFGQLRDRDRATSLASHQTAWVPNIERLQQAACKRVWERRLWQVILIMNAFGGVRRSALTRPEHKEKNKFPVPVTRGPEDIVKKHLTIVGDPIPSKEDVKQPDYNYRDSDVHRSI